MEVTKFVGASEKMKTTIIRQSSVYLLFYKEGDGKIYVGVKLDFGICPSKARLAVWQVSGLAKTGSFGQFGGWVIYDAVDNALRSGNSTRMVKFVAGRDGSPMCHIGNTVSFPDRNGPKPKVGDIWEVEIKGQNPKGTVNFLRLVQKVECDGLPEDIEQLHGEISRWRNEERIADNKRWLEENISDDMEPELKTQLLTMAANASNSPDILDEKVKSFRAADEKRRREEDGLEGLLKDPESWMGLYEKYKSLGDASHEAYKAWTAGIARRDQAKKEVIKAVYVVTKPCDPYGMFDSDKWDIGVAIRTMGVAISYQPMYYCGTGVVDVVESNDGMGKRDVVAPIYKKIDSKIMDKKCPNWREVGRTLLKTFQEKKKNLGLLEEECNTLHEEYNKLNNEEREIKKRLFEGVPEWMNLDHVLKLMKGEDVTEEEMLMMYE